MKNYNGEHFGFAVKNYYAEFLAADQVYRYEDKYFPGPVCCGAVEGPSRSDRARPLRLQTK
jgi:hypothetical protein